MISKKQSHWHSLCNKLFTNLYFQASPNRTPNRTPKKMKRHVRISSPPVLDSSSGDTTADQSILDFDSKTPPPLTLTDEEFMARFIPKTP